MKKGIKSLAEMQLHQGRMKGKALLYQIDPHQDQLSQILSAAQRTIRELNLERINPYLVIEDHPNRFDEVNSILNILYFKKTRENLQAC
jgi:hypothetical protein